MLLVVILRIIGGLLIGAFLGGGLFIAFGFVALFISDEPLFVAMIGFLLGLIGYLCLELMPDGKCPKCKKSYYNEMCEQGSNNLSRDVLPNIFTDDKGKIKTEYIATGLRKVFYKCLKCGHEWDETVRYKEKDKQRI